MYLLIYIVHCIKLLDDLILVFIHSSAQEQAHLTLGPLCLYCTLVLCNFFLFKQYKEIQTLKIVSVNEQWKDIKVIVRGGKVEICMNWSSLICVHTMFFCDIVVKEHQTRTIAQPLGLAVKKVVEESKVALELCLVRILLGGGIESANYQMPSPRPFHCGRSADCLHPCPVACPLYLQLPAELNLYTFSHQGTDGSFSCLLKDSRQMT